MFSSRLPASLSANRLTRALERAQAGGRRLLDLTVSNPTLVGLEYPADLLAPLAAPAALQYTPEPFGLAVAREAVAQSYGRLGGVVEPAHVVLTASTSEAYAWLFKLLCDPGDEILVPQPGYPLFEHLGRLEQARVVGYALEPHAHWTIDRLSLETATSTRTRAVVVVSPNNPTGSRLAHDDWRWLDQWCAARDIAVIVDEVFADFPIAPLPDRVTTVTAPASAWSPRALTVALGGLSKSCGLPQVKVGWMVVGGAPDRRAPALARLEVIADAYLSVSTPAQLAVPALLSSAGPVRAQIGRRLEENLAIVEEAVAAAPACSLFRPEAGWSAVVRAPAVVPEEDLVVDLVEEDDVLVHPGYFFDFPFEVCLVVSLLTPPPVVRAGMERVTARIASRYLGRGPEAAASSMTTGRP